MAEKRLEGRPVQESSAEENVKLVAELTIKQEELNIQTRSSEGSDWSWRSQSQVF